MSSYWGTLLLLEARGCNCVLGAINRWGIPLIDDSGPGVVFCSLWYAFLNDFYTNLQRERDSQTNSYLTLELLIYILKRI